MPPGQSLSSLQSSTQYLSPVNTVEQAGSAAPSGCGAQQSQISSQGREQTPQSGSLLLFWRQVAKSSGSSQAPFPSFTQSPQEPGGGSPQPVFEPLPVVWSLPVPAPVPELVPVSLPLSLPLSSPVPEPPPPTEESSLPHPACDSATITPTNVRNMAENGTLIRLRSISQRRLTVAGCDVNTRG